MDNFKAEIKDGVVQSVTITSSGQGYTPTHIKKIEVKKIDTGKIIKGFIISASGRVFLPSEIGDDADFEKLFDNGSYFDNVSFAEITDEVEIFLG